MRFSEWLERRVAEALDPELDRLKRDEKLLLMSIEGRKDSKGMVHGINKAGVIDAVAKLKEVRAKIKAKESGSEAKPIPAWMQGRRAV